MIESELYILKEPCMGKDLSPRADCLFGKFQIKERLSLVRIRSAYGFYEIEMLSDDSSRLLIKCYGCNREGTGELILEETETK